MVGAALLLDSRPEASLSLLISESHGAKRRPGKYWFGHAELVVDTGEESALVLTARRVAFGDLQSTNWLPGLRPEEQDVITGLAPRATGFGEDTVTPSEVMSYLAGIVDADEAEFSARNRYRAYSFAEGVERYQLDHPDLRAGPIVQVADYINLYNRLTTA
ncbi:MAG TPA: hypothetical protein VFT58_06395 [Nitrososphaera sp.]|nr:hypothetical protein [Nitrososphaera sp.]